MRSSALKHLWPQESEICDTNFPSIRHASRAKFEKAFKEIKVEVINVTEADRRHSEYRV